MKKRYFIKHIYYLIKLSFVLQSNFFDKDQFCTIIVIILLKMNKEFTINNKIQF
jgi:hypothetical protein